MKGKTDIPFTAYAYFRGWDAPNKGQFFVIVATIMVTLSSMDGKLKCGICLEFFQDPPQSLFTPIYVGGGGEELKLSPPFVLAHKLRFMRSSF